MVETAARRRNPRESVWAPNPAIYSSKIIKAGALLADTKTLLAHWDPVIPAEAKTDKAQGSGQAESLDVFHEYRSEIENLASAKYDAGKIRSDGLVVVDSPDLNPEQFQQGLA